MNVVNQINKFLFIIVLLELFLGGGGRNIEFGFLTLRMILFSTILFINIPIFFYINKVEKNMLLLFGYFSICTIFSVFWGLHNNAPLKLIFEDIKPLTYYFSFLFFFNYIKNETDIKLIIKILKVSCFILTLLSISLFLILHLDLIDFNFFYNLLSQSGEFAFRENTAVFYKGYLYLCVGLFFFYNENDSLSKSFSFIIIIAIIFTFTRGFILSVILANIIYMFYAKKNYNTILYVFLATFFITLILIFYSNINIGDKALSNSIRTTAIMQVFERVNIVSFIFGHGFGNGVPIREIHMEISYLEIFHKQGIIGLLFWIFLFLQSTIFYKKALKNGYILYAKPFFLSIIFVYVQSFTNPFINNPIGLSLLIISLLSLYTLGYKIKKNDDISLHSNI